MRVKIRKDNNYVEIEDNVVLDNEGNKINIPIDITDAITLAIDGINQTENHSYWMKKIKEYKVKINEKYSIGNSNNKNELKIEELIKAKNDVYEERNQLIAFLSTCYPSYLTKHPEDDFEIVCIDTPTGQMTWHIYDLELVLFAHLTTKNDHVWDGHTTTEKYKRLKQLIYQKKRFKN